MTRAHVLIPLLCSSFFLACSDGRTSGPRGVSGPGVSNGPGAIDASMPPASGDLGTPLPAAYPPGPYGNQVGDTLADFSAPGYLANHTWSTSIRLADLRAGGTCKCLLLTIGTSWCGACQQEQPDLVDAIGSDPQFCVLGVLQEGPSGDPAVRADVDDWEAYYHQNFPVVQGTSQTEQLMSGYGSSVALPFAFVVKPSTMKVLDNVQGYSSDLHTYARSLCGY